MAVASKAPVERINSGKKRPPPPPRQGRGRKAQGKKDAPVIPVSAWAKPLIPIAAAGVQGKVVFKNKPPAAKAGPLIKAIKVEKAARSLAENEFLKELSLEAPDLVDSIKKQSEAEGRSWFTVEISCAPDQGWTYVGDSPDLDAYVTEKSLLQSLAAMAGQSAEQTIKMELIKSVKSRDWPARSSSTSSRAPLRST